MKSTDSAHALDHETEQPEHAAEVGPLQRRTKGRASSSQPDRMVLPSPPWTFGNAVNAGIHDIQARGALNGPDVHAMAAHGVSGSGGSLPHMSAIQASFGHHDVSAVQAHVGGRAAEASEAIGAEAYASGNSVAFSSAPDLHLAAHEAAHVVQQRGGVRLSGGVGRSGDEYEQHADAVADLVVQGKSAESLLDRYAHRGAVGGDAVQKQDRPHRGGGGTAHEETPHEPTAAEMCSAADDSTNPSLATDAMATTATTHARSIGTTVPSTAVSDCTAEIERIVSEGRSGSTRIFTATLRGDYLVNYDWRISARVERREVATCATGRGTGTFSGSRTTGTSRTGSEHRTTDRTETEVSGTAGSRSGTDDHNGRTREGTARRTSESTTADTHTSSGDAARTGRGTEAHAPSETSDRVYEYFVTWTVETEISRTWSDPATAYADIFRGAFEPTPWTHTSPATSIGTRREQDTHVAPTRRAAPRPHRPERIE